ncbi:hypothetical protein RirG_213820 [Rhizophagus irregularis DAOM 197198w]|uniref:B30.2/SPRY domain-containing protein n=1 Tax=Rhizophagus irregularis (strain DAOM 197198w) TaxID=1432141 RepID=A0A015JP24_RHIIW|nr:hypothetical protein RirG_213820 [Rhizophagus irregularis DAOM 197198w]
MSQVLINWVAKNKLENSEIDSLSLKGLKYFLEKTYDTQIPFATPEFNIWEYTLAKFIRKVIQNETIIERILDKKSFSMCEPQEIEGIKNHSTPLIKFINLKRMDGEEIEQHVEPFGTYPTQELKKSYSSILNGRELGFIRGVPIFRWKNNGSSLKISVDGFTVEGNGLVKPKSVLGNLIFKGKGVYEWNILIEKLNNKVYIGICDINVNLNENDKVYHGWVLGSDGYAYHEKKWKRCCAKFKEGNKITIHLDMKNKTCAFSINNNKKFVVSGWQNIPSQVYPIASLGHTSKLRIEPKN